jgi:hypothetical protein
MMSISGSGGRSELDTTNRLVGQMPTSGMGQTRTSDRASARSAHPPIAEVRRSQREVRKVPILEVTARRSFTAELARPAHLCDKIGTAALSDPCIRAIHICRITVEPSRSSRDPQ